jgi:hypothetical protein
MVLWVIAMVLLIGGWRSFRRLTSYYGVSVWPYVAAWGQVVFGILFCLAAIGRGEVT